MNLSISSIVWIAAALILGFGISAWLAGQMRLARGRFLIGYVLFVTAFLLIFIKLNPVDLQALFARKLLAGIVSGALAAVFLIWNVTRQPASRQTRGGKLVFDLLWPGLIYGAADAIFLNILPVLAVSLAFSSTHWAAGFPGTLVSGLLGWIASLAVALTYHLGYPEYRNRGVLKVLVGNGIITLAFLLSGNPLGALISHSAMHIAAVLRGPETTIQLPPHYAGD